VTGFITILCWRVSTVWSISDIFTLGVDSSLIFLNQCLPMTLLGKQNSLQCHAVITLWESILSSQLVLVLVATNNAPVYVLLSILWSGNSIFLSEVSLVVIPTQHTPLLWMAISDSIPTFIILSVDNLSIPTTCSIIPVAITLACVVSC
jgi:hypothetical protein